MALSTYAELQASIAGWLNREDMTVVIPDLIRLAEARFDKEVRFRGMLVRDITTVDEDYENLPGDFLELKSIRFNTADPSESPEYVTPSMIHRLRARNIGRSDAPRYYTILGNQLLFDRVPVGAPELDIMSYVKLDRLSVTVESNVLLDLHPDVYLWGSLAEAEPYLKNDERVPLWESKYRSAVAALEGSDRKAESSPSPLIIRPKRTF